MFFLPGFTKFPCSTHCSQVPAPAVTTKRTVLAPLVYNFKPAAGTPNFATEGTTRLGPMGKRRGIKSKQKPGQLLQQQPDQSDVFVNQPLLLAFQPGSDSLAISEGSQVSIYSSSSTKRLELLPGQSHVQGQVESATAVQAVAFDAQAKHIVIGGDDKTLQLWSVQTWQLLQRWQIPKRISAAAFSADGNVVYFADKWGDVHAVRIPSLSEPVPLPLASSEPPSRLNKGDRGQSGGDGDPVLLLGHFCSIVTSLCLSADGKLIVSTDRDGKVRVSNLPADPLQGAPEIQSYCLGHTAFATCSAIIRSTERELLLSGSGDGTVRLWDLISGCQLARWDVPEHTHSSQHAQEDGAANGTDASVALEHQNELSEPTDKSAELAQDNLGDDIEADEQAASGAVSDRPDVLALSVSPTRPDVAIIVEGSPAITVLTVGSERLSLQESQQLPCGSSGSSLPAAVSFDSHGRLWAAAKVPCTSGTATELHVWLPPDAAGGYQALSHPEALSSGLQQALRDHPQQSADACAAAAPSQASQQLRKRQYTRQEIDSRKAKRRDRILTS